ncbi:carbohydrate-binding protein [Paenibacillus gorillae]|uniref:carbohydrate-binding protein n=1 Tax=Paenibacillus gorillae TaxID=1243662 RepID=UPI0004B3914F|nr:carbohydrate-binding protein [Paenibacillus gorillae]
MLTKFLPNGFAHKIKRLTIALFIVSLVLSSSFGSFNGKVHASTDFVYYVAPDGDDSNPGTLSEPFATLTKAQTAIRELKAANGIPDGGVTVYLRNGEYIQSTTFTLTPDDSGSEGSPIVYQSYPGETAIISSKQEITGWSLLEDSYPAGLPESSKGKVFVANISPGWRFHSMFVNDVSQPVAKSFQNTNWTTWPVLTAAGSPSPSGRSITFPQGVLDHIPSNRDVEISMTTAWWWNIVAPIDSIDPVNNTAKLQSKAPVQFENLLSLEGGHYNIFNALPVLDQAGEWVVDSAAGKVYYWPSDGTMSGKTVFAPKLNEILRLQGDEEAQNWTNQVQYVEFRNLQFMYSDRTPEDQYNPDWLVRNAENPDAMIYMQGVSHIVMDSNLIAYSGSQGIALDHYAQHVTLTRNEIAYSSSGGIQITGYGPGDVDVNKNHIIERNHVHHVGLDYMHSGPLSIYGSNNNTIKYNYFHDSPYAGISIVGTHYEPMNDPSKVDTTDSYGNNQAFYQMRWTEVEAHRPYDPFTGIPYMHSSDNTVQYNIVDNYMEALHDGGALYTWSAGTNTLWDHNVGTSPLNKGVSIYFDNHTAYNTASNNIFWSPGDGYFNNSGNSTNTSTNNVIMDINKPPGYDLLRNTIINTVNAQGGWLGAALTPVEIPTSATDIHQAENYDTAQGAHTEDGGTGKYIGLASEGDWAGYKNIDFGEVNSINQINVSVAVDPAHAGKQLEVRLDSVTGELIGTLTLNDTGGSTTFTTQNASITGASGVRDLFIVAKGSGSGFLNMDWFTFSTKATSIIQAEIFSASQGVQTGAEGTGKYLGWIDGGDWIGYYNIDFGNGQLDQFQVSAAADPSYAGKELELRLDSITGPLIGTYTFNNTGGFTTFQTQTIPISGASGVHHLFLVAKGSGSGYGNIDWFTFSTKATSIIQAENFSASQGVQTGVEGTGRYLGWIDGGDWIGYYNIDFGSGQLNQFQVRAAADPGYAGKELELRLDSITGPLIGTYTFNNTGGFTTFQTQTIPISAVSGVHHLFLVAKGSGAGYGNIDWFTFSTKATSIIQAENFSASHGVQTGAGGTGRYLGWIDGGDWIGYYNIDFGSGQSNQFQVRAAADPGYASKELELRLDSITGPLIGTYTFNNTGGFTTFQTQTIPVSGASGVHHLFLVTKGSGVGYGSIDWFTFK